MIARGRVKDGIVVLEDGTRLPEGTPVIVWPDVPSLEAAVPMGEDAEQVSEEAHRHEIRLAELE